MEIKLIELTLENFKGIKKFHFSPGGDNASIFGDNAAGKTTVADGSEWVKSGKDTRDKTDFAIKPLDEEGKTTGDIETMVKEILDIDGKTIELKKVYIEKWTRPRRRAEKILTTHTTKRYIDGKFRQKKEWDKHIASLIPVEEGIDANEIYKLVTRPDYFNSEKLKDIAIIKDKNKRPWQVRRDILFKVADIILTDEDIIAANEELSELPGILKGMSQEDYKQIIKEEKKANVKRRDEIVPSIKELKGQLPTEFRNRKAIEAMVNLLDKQIEKARDDTELAGLRKELAEAEVKLAEAKAAYTKETGEANAGTDEAILKLKTEIRGLTFKKGEIQDDIKDNQLNIDRNEQNMAELRANHNQIATQEQPHEKICFNCNEPLPEKMIADSLAKFKVHQANELDVINAQGKALKVKTGALADSVVAFEKKIMEIECDIETTEKKITDLELKKKDVEPLDPPEIIKLEDEVTRLNQAVTSKKLFPATDTTALQAERREEMEKLAALDAAVKTKYRIEELKAEEKKLSAEFEDLESQIFLMEKFIVQKVNMLEGKINSKFDLARFKLFDVQINEGVKECCITTVNGVPYGSGLNKGMEINVGLDILKTLSKHYGITAPVWIDNAEAVTKLLDIPSQTFKLIVSGKHKEMEVEYG